MTGLVGHWKLDGNASDYSGKGNSGTIHGATARADRFGITNSALSFNGTTSDYVDCGTTAILNLTGSFTISAWIYKTSFKNTYEQIVAKTTAGGSGGYEFGVQANHKLYITNGPSTPVANTALLSNTWYHATVVFNGTSTHFYLNGVSDSGDSGAITFPSSSSKMGIGRAPDRANFPFVGYIDDVRIYNRALTAADVTALYHNGGPTTVRNARIGRAVIR